MSERILIIDDNIDTLKVINLMLRRQGYEVSTANAGKPGLEKAFSENPKVILLDMMMPDMDGLEVCRQLRAEPTTKETPIIMFTAKTLVEDKIAGFEAGVTDYLTKPIHPAELVARIKNILRSASPSDSVLPGYSTDTSSQSIGFVGAKGGVGTSTLAASIGAIFAESFSTILTEIHPGQGTLGLSLGISDNAGLSSVLNQSVNQITSELVAEHLVEHNSKMRLLLSSSKAQEFMFTYSPESVLALKNALAKQAQFCLFDLGSGLHRSTVPVMRGLDNIILLTEPNLVSLAITSSIIATLETHTSKEKIRVVVSNRTESISQISKEDIEAQLRHSVTGIIPPATDIAYQAAAIGTSITQLKPDSDIATEISKLAEVLVSASS